MDINSLIVPFSVLVVISGVVLLFLLKGKSLPYPYKSKGPYLLSNGERIFFNTLSELIPNNLYICPHVRIADLVEVGLPRNSPDFWKYFSKISQKHVDFVICTRNDFLPKLVIELDGGSHKNGEKEVRDQFVDDVFEKVQIPILHVQTTYLSNKQFLSEKLNSYIVN